MRRFAHAAAFTSSLLAMSVGMAGPALAAPAVVASVKPIHSLVATVMQGVGSPSLLLESGQSPHTYSLTPSEAATLERADLVVWVGPALEAFLVRPVRNIARPDASLPLLRLDGLTLLQTREGGAWAGHAHAHDQGHDHDDDHDHDSVHDRGEAGTQDGARNQEVPADRIDPHIWLDPTNARRIVDALAKRLAEIDPDNAAVYQANARDAADRLDALDRELARTLQPVRTVPYVVFHDAYHYFEDHYRLNAVGSITLNPDRTPGAQRLVEIRRKIANLGARCVFREPQFAPDLVQTVVENNAASVATLDPLGVDQPAGPGAYAQMMRDLAASLRSCLSPKS